MKKKLLSILLSLALVVTMMPMMTMTAFAADDFAITNGTPESAQGTNHGYITIDKATAVEGETVTITVNPADGYQLKSLTATPVAPTISTIADVLATVEGFPKDIIENSSPTAPSDAWTNGTGSAFTYKNLALVLKSSSYMYAQLTTGVTFDATNKCYTATVSTLGTLKFNMTDGVLTSFEYTGNTKHDYDGTYTPANTPSAKLQPITPEKQEDGTYQFEMPAANVTVTAEFEEKAITIADILPDDFPTFSWPLPDNVWKNSVGSKMYINNNGLTFGGVNLYNILSKPVTKDGNNYKYISNPYTITFVMDSDKLVKVITEGAGNADNNGEYIPSHTHSFTYTVNNGKLTATCTQGCDKGYDTTTLTLTLTAPASLVYDGIAKVFTFADGEAAAWTGAGLELPTITYYQKYSGQGWYTQLNEVPVNAGGDYMAEIVVNNIAAQVYFAIDKATPYIKTTPAPNDIEYGKKLSDSTLFGGYVQISSADSTEVGGLFEWTNPDTVPGIDDSEVTLFDVTFTPADTKNYNTVSCKVTVKVNHTHAPVLAKGQAPTEIAAGFKDYYECECGDLFEDATGLIPIENLDAWKSSAGNGYLAPLVHTVTPVNGQDATDTEAGYKAYYECKNCGKYYEDATGLIEISDINVWKAEGGNGYIAKLKEAPLAPEPKKEEYTIPVESEDTVQVEATIENGTAEVKEITKETLEEIVQPEEGKKSTTDTIVIDLSQAKQDVTGIVLTSKSLENLKEVLASDKNEIKTVVIQMSEATVEIDAKTLEAVSKEADGNSIRLVVDKTEEKQLNTQQKETLVNYNVDKTFEAYFESNGQRIASFNGGEVVVGIKFTPGEGRNANHYKIYYIDENGKMQKFASKYENGMLKFSTTHFSDYVIVYDDKVEVLLLQGKTSGKNAIKLSWNELDNTTKYVVYGNSCGKTAKKLKTVKSNKFTVKKIAGKKLVAHKVYKFYVVGYDAVGNKTTSKTIHFIAANTQGKYANVKSIKAKATTLQLAVGEFGKVGATYKMYSGKKHLGSNHGKALRYISDNPEVVSVSSTGKVLARQAGTATIYIQDVGGKYVKTIVTVK